MIHIPIPKPAKGEEQDKFISRCMGDKVMNKDYPEQKQRAAICYGQWKSSKESSDFDEDNGQSDEDETNDCKETAKKEVKRDEKGRIIIAENVPIVLRGTLQE